jgi:hypothetical protein
MVAIAAAQVAVASSVAVTAIHAFNLALEIVSWRRLSTFCCTSLVT